MSKPFTVEYKGPCKLIDIYDGDTIKAEFPIDNENSKKYIWKCRLYGINSPEIKTKNSEEKSKGLLSKDHLHSLLTNKELMIECKGLDCFGRVLCILFSNDIKGNINDLMIKDGFAVEYKH